MPEQLPKIYAFANANHDPRIGGYPVVAIAEDGYVLGSHFCSNMSYAQHDLHDRADRQAACEAHYPEGYEFVICPEGTFPPDEVFERNKALQPTPAPRRMTPRWRERR